MTLDIKRTPDSVTLTAADVRGAIADYVERKARRRILNADAIVYHATNKGEARSGKDCDTVYATVQLQDVAPTPHSFDFGEQASTIGDDLDEAVSQLKRYGGEPKLSHFVAVVEALAVLNDDLAHDRDIDGSQFHVLRIAVKNLQAAIARRRVAKPQIYDDSKDIEQLK